MKQSVESIEANGVGRIEAIHITTQAGEPMQSVDRVRVTAGVGLEGDRYATGRGHWSRDQQVRRDLTLIEAGVIDDLHHHFGLVFETGATRRNLTTRGIRLNVLVGRRFRIGTVLCDGTRLCEPCQYLADLVGQPILKPLVHRGGLRANIVTSGYLQVGDAVQPVVNAGSVGLPYDGDPRASYALIEDGVSTIRRVAYDLDTEEKAIAEANFPLAEWLIQVERQGRFWRPAV